MVNQERIQLLIDALRSGEYEQGQGRLTTVMADGTQKDCCLGVGCKVAMKNGLDIDTVIVETDDGMDHEYNQVDYAGEGQIMPHMVAKWFGLGFDINPQLETDDGPFAAAHVNDKLGYTFEQIADAFQQTYIDSEEE